MPGGAGSNPVAGIFFSPGHFTGRPKSIVCSEAEDQARRSSADFLVIIFLELDHEDLIAFAISLRLVHTGCEPLTTFMLPHSHGAVARDLIPDTDAA